MVILDRDKYVTEAMRQLNDSEVYISLRDDPTVDKIRKVNGGVEKLHNDRCISQSTVQYLMVTNDAKAGHFYLLPKIHKKIVLGVCLLYTSPSPRDLSTSRMPSSA